MFIHVIYARNPLKEIATTFIHEDTGLTIVIRQKMLYKNTRSIKIYIQGLSVKK